MTTLGEQDNPGELVDADPETGEVDGDLDAEPYDQRAAFLDWFDAHFRTIEVSGNREAAPWCPQWWLHPEVSARLWALFRAHQAVEVSESLAALSDWWLQHWDRHRAVLFDGQTGPFKDCDPNQGHLFHGRQDKTRPLVPAVLPPDEWQLPSP